MSWNYTWKDISLKQIYTFNDLESNPKRAIEYLAKEFSLEESNLNAIILDSYYYALKFAKKQESFSPPKTSAFFSILKQTLDSIIATPQIKPEKDYNSFKELLLMHSVQRPPLSEKIFEPTEMKAINEYALNTCFRHYLLYKYAFTAKTFLNVDASLEASKASDAICTDSKLEVVGATVADSDSLTKAGDSLVCDTLTVDPHDKGSKSLPPGVELLSPAQKTEKALADLKLLVSAAVNTKLQELKSNLQQTIKAQEDMLTAQVNQISEKLEQSQEQRT